MVMTIGLRTVTEVVEIDPSDLNRICQEEEKVEVTLIKVQSVKRPRVASRSVSRDSIRCFYCKEPSHIPKFCLRRQEDESRLKRGSANMMANIHSQFDDAYETFDDLYDDQVEYLNI